VALPLPEYDQLDATGMAELVRKGDVSPEELLDAALARVDARNPSLNAVVHDLRDRARLKVGELPDGPLKGVPFMLKDLKQHLAGTPVSGGCKLLKGRPSRYTSELTRRYEASGMQIIGRTNSPEFGIMGITEPELWGPCRNPWNRDHTPGGSSGGAASAVAARIVPVAHGGDGGGSIRIPASCCGLVGLKPTRGRVTMKPTLGDAWQGFVQEHVLARTVRDTALLLDVEDSEPTTGEPYVAPPKPGPWIDEVGRDPGTLRIAICRDALFGNHQDADCVAAVDDAADLLRGLGHEVEVGTPPFPQADLVRAYFLVVAAGVACFVEEAAAEVGKKPRFKDFEPGTWILALIGWKSSAAELEWARRKIQLAARGVADFFDRYDVFVTSTLARPPARVGELALSVAEEMQVQILRNIPIKRVLDFAMDQMGNGKLRYTPNTQLFNQTGQPGMSLPLMWNNDGLPIGTQFVSRFGDEATLLRLASQLEQARPWDHKLPLMVRP
jgi:amidase